LYRARALRVPTRRSEISQSGPGPAWDSTFTLLRLRLLSLLAVSKIRMLSRHSFRWLRVLPIAVSCCSLVSIVHAQGAKQTVPQNPIPDSDTVHIKERNEWFFRGRLVHGKRSAELRRRAFHAKLQMRARHRVAIAAAARANGQRASSVAPLSSSSWTPLGPMLLASDASGNGTQDYHQVSGRATAVAIDPADPSGNRSTLEARKAVCGSQLLRPIIPPAA
jgi:hypothetical protein